jgi:hypothetical protein
MVADGEEIDDLQQGWVQAYDRFGDDVGRDSAVVRPCRQYRP